MRTDYLSLSQILPALLWMIILLVVAHLYRTSKKNDPTYKYFLPNIYFKLGASISFASFYVFVLGGGDTTAYYDGALALNNLLLDSPADYYHQMSTSPDWKYYTVDFTSRTGYPPSWIFKEAEGYFVCKVLSLFTILTFKSYFAATFIISFIAALVSHQLYRLTLSMKLFNTRYLALAVLFIPSVNFWCTGVSKDSIVLISLLGTTYHVFLLLVPEYKNKLINWVMILVYVTLIYNIRPFILIAISLPLLYAISARLLTRIGMNNFMVSLTRTTFLLGILYFAGASFFSQSEDELVESNELIQQAQTIQQDFRNNKAYGDKRYDLGSVEFTGAGLVKVMPMAILYGMLAPFIWQSINLTLILNGLESMLFIYLFFIFIRRAPFRKIAFIRNNEFLTYSLILVIILAFLTGLTSGLYGVLVRVRAPLLIFLTLILIIDWSQVDLHKRKKNKSGGRLNRPISRAVTHNQHELDKSQIEKE